MDVGNGSVWIHPEEVGQTLIEEPVQTNFVALKAARRVPAVSFHFTSVKDSRKERLA